MKPSSIWLPLALALILYGVSASAQTQYSYTGCTDRKGQPVPSKADPASTMVVETRLEDGRPVIAYNPGAMPQLLPETRLFLFAHECARHQLGMPAEGGRTLEQARRSDCQAVGMMQRSGLLKGDALSAIESDLQMAQNDWVALPGPARETQLAACLGKGGAKRASGDVLALPDNAAPATDKWNACVQNCGARLFSCGTGSSCQQSYDQCSARCDAAR